MKIINRFFLAVLLFIAFYSCKKNDATTLPYSTYGIAESQGQLKIVYASAYLSNPAVLIKINGKTVSNLITGRTVFPGGGYNVNVSNFPLYLAVSQGPNTIDIVRPKIGTDTDSLVFYSTVVNIPDNKAYTLLITDTLVNAGLNKTTSVLLNNDITAIDTGSVRCRFVNLIPNVATTGGAVDLYVNETLISQATNIAYKQSSPVFTVKTFGIVPTWKILPAGAASNATPIASYLSSNTVINQRAYTVFSMGYAGATGTRLPYLSFTLDKNN